MRQVKPKKHLGQHFLVDLNIAKRIADTVDACPELPVLEIGPGMGVLTRPLLDRGHDLTVVESALSVIGRLLDWFRIDSITSLSNPF